MRYCHRHDAQLSDLFPNVTSPDLFNLYSEIILRKLEDIQEGIMINGVKINNLRFADDMALLATSTGDLQILFDVDGASSECLGLNISSKKT